MPASTTESPIALQRDKLIESTVTPVGGEGLLLSSGTSPMAHSWLPVT